ncbi:MAG: hypothetical protein KDA65_05465 [Planctomycetaceae bacterium]|nr:hypothetical protein [Planctomycetaceae bacterium]
MQIVLPFDDFDWELVSKYTKRGRSPYFKVFFSHQNRSYPDESWFDFGTVILGWWSIDYKNIFEGKFSGEFLFMDGPYGLNATVSSDTRDLILTPPDKSFQWEIPTREFGIELRSALNHVMRELESNGIDYPEKESLKKGLQLLQNIP